MGDVRLQQDLWTVNSGACLALLKIGRKLLPRDRRQLSANPARLDKERMNIGKGPNASFNCLLQPLKRVGLRKLDGGEHVRNQVLASMLGLPSQSGDLLLSPLLLAHVPCDLRRSNDLAVGVLDGRNCEGNDNQASVFALPNGLEMVDALPRESVSGSYFLQHAGLANHNGDGLADRLFRRIAKDPFGPLSSL